jgi:asparagine N-glycosylation enzyme membrane subunit Stt3
MVKGIRTVRRYVWNRKFTLVFLVLMVLLAFAVRSVWYYSAAYTGGPTPLLSGNDPDYHKRTVDYFVGNHHFLQRDPLIDYPQGGPNPNPPAYSTSVALVGYIISPLFHFDLGAAVWFSMEIGAALWASLTVIPVYLFTKEMFGRKAGYFAAFLIAMMAGNIERTPLGFSDHDGFFMFFVVCGFFFFLKALRLSKTKSYVRSWRVPYDITVGLQGFVSTNRLALLYSAMAGMSLAVVALAWKGFTYAMAIIFVYLLFHLMLNKFRRYDNTAVGVIVLVTTSVLMLVALPYYMSMHFMNWLEAPAILYVAIVLIVAVFVLTRDLPWLLIIPVLLGLLAVVLTVVWVLLPDVWTNVFSGAGYFIRTKLYGTIAEAQPPDVNRLVFSYGLTTFFLALAGVVLMIKNMPKGWKSDQIFTTIWAVTSIYMAVAAIRFMYNATPVFAILSGWVLYEIMKRLDYRRMLRVFRSMRGDLGKAFKYSVKVRHVVGVIFLAFLIVAPNTWNAVDAGIPYEDKKKADLDVYNALPSFMRPAKKLYDPTSNSLWYFGSFGTSFMNDYWAQGMWWLRTQDDWMPEEDRPAFISWWDYGHWCVQVGKHPTAADNFQNGVEFAGNFIAAQSEEEAAALMAVRIMQLEYWRPAVREYMNAQLGEANATKLVDLFQDPSKYTPDIAKYPERYGLKDTDVSSVNTVFIVGTYLVDSAKTEEQLTDMLLWFRNTLGDEYRYFAVDSRLMPLSYQNTGIFYAPITLSDNRVDEFIEVVGIYNGNQITLEQASTLSATERQSLTYQLVWKKPFYDSMFYRTFIGYSGYDQGPDFKDAGIPLISGDLANSLPLPGWNMTHWRVVHRTIHWNPWNESTVKDHTLDWQTISEEQALQYAAEKKGSIDEVLRTIGNGVIYLKYYAGAYINGTVTTETGEPISGALVTVYDDYRYFHDYYAGADFVGIPHGTTYTDAQGRYSILAPFGNVTVVASSGGSLEYTYLREKNVLNRTNVLVTDDQAMRVGQYNLTVDLLVPIAHLNGTVYQDLNTNNKRDPKTDKMMGNATLLLTGNRGLNKTYAIPTGLDGFFELPSILPGEYNVSVVYEGHRVGNYTTLTLAANETKSSDLAVPLGKVVGTLSRKDGKAVEGTVLTARDLQNNQTRTVEAAKDGAYAFDKLLPGNWSVELYVPGTRPINETVALTKTVSTEYLNLTILPTAFIEGVVFRDSDSDGSPGPGEGVANATITYARLYGEALVWTVTTNATGDYNTSLPSGVYSAYASVTSGTDHWASLRRLVIEASDWSYAVDVPLGAAYRVNGTFNRTNTASPGKTLAADRAQIDLWSQDARVRLTANATGVFSLYLPKGNYTVFAQKTPTDRPLIDLRWVNVTSAPLDLGTIVLTNGTRLEGAVFFDRNRNNAVDSAEGRGRLNVIFEAAGLSFNATTLSNGSYRLNAAPLNYTVTVTADGFEAYTGHINATANLLPTSQNINLHAYNVSYDGTAGYDWEGDSNLTGNGFADLWVTFGVSSITSTTAVPTHVVTDVEGHYRTTLAPGTYSINVTLDRTEALGKFRYTYSGVLEILPGTTNKTYNVWLDRSVQLNGTVLYENGTLVGTNYDPEFIRVDLGTKWISVRDGNFSDYVTVGNHTLLLEVQQFNGTTSTTTHIALAKVSIDRPTRLDLVARAVVKFNGTVYYDRNQNGAYDSGEGIHLLNFLLRGIREETVYQETGGNFSAFYYPNPNYTLFIQRVQSDTVDKLQYEYYRNMTVNLTKDTTLLIPVERRFSVGGVVYWDKNGDKQAQSGEYVANATVTFVSKSDGRTYTATSNNLGSYRLYLPVDNKTTGKFDANLSREGFTPKKATVPLNVSVQNKTLDWVLTPNNVTLMGTTFLDLNGNGAMNRYERGVPVAYIEFWDRTNVSRAFEASSDINGSFSFVVPPGTYDVWAWTPEGTGNIVHLGTTSVEPTGSDFTLKLAMVEGRTASGEMYYLNQTRQNHTAPSANLTFVPIDGDGKIPVLNTTGGAFSVVLPDGRYSVNGTFNNTQFGVTMKYSVDTDFRVVLKDKADVALNFSKVPERKLRLLWSDIPTLIDQNGSVNYTIYAQNTGSENATFDLSMTVPSNWKYSLEVKNLTLNLSQSGHLWVVINSSNRSISGKNNCTLEAKPRGATDTPSKLVVAVDIKQVYGFDVRAPPQQQSGMYRYDATTHVRHATYSVLLENKGNGKEVLNITVGSILDWKITVPLRVNITLEPFMIQPQIPIEIELPNATVLAPQRLTVTVKSVNNPTQAPKTIELVITFPDLSVSGKTLKVSQSGKEVKQPASAPGMGTIAMLVALGAAAVVASRGRRGWRS